MNKIGLCIVYKNWNYGSILQSYATLVELKKLGCEYEIIRYEPKKNIIKYLSSFRRAFLPDMLYSKKRKLKRLIGKKLHSKFSKNDEKRIMIFREFVEKRFGSFSAIITDYYELCKYSERFDCILVGSDQLWLPSGLDTNFYNLQFASDKVNKVAYAASFGVTSIPKFQLNKTREYLNRINHISVREYSGQAIINKLISKKIDVIIDPTMVITKEEWDNNVKDKCIIDEPYIFCYFLGANKKYREAVNILSKKSGIKVVTLRHMDEYIAYDERFGDYAPYDVGPVEFINLIRYATYICTDSFHGSVFSIINHKKFVTFSRYSENSKNSRNSRIDSLFSQLEINPRYSGNILSDINRNIDYERVDERLKMLRSEAEEFLTRAIGIKND